MKLEKAYAIELKRAISPVEADIKYINGEITSKFNFKCPDDNCNAAVTCANLERPKIKRKVDPYYKVVEDHSSQCLIGKDISGIKRDKTKYTDIYSEEDEYISNAVRFNLRPHSEKRPKDDIKPTDDEIVLKNKPNLKNTNSTETKRRKQSTKVLSSMVDSFLNNESINVQVPGIGTMSITELFIEINGQNISDFVDEFRVYYGKAWINKVSTGYRVAFINTLSHNENETSPSFFIPTNLLSATTYRLFQENKLDELTDKKPKHIFIVSETGPHAKDKYINFRLEALEYLEYRII